jgi:tRNA A22 N-methylase
MAKIKMNMDPNSFTVVKGKLLREAQKIYMMLLASKA